MAAVIDEAARVGARVVFGDNLYTYGRVEGPLTGPGHTQERDT